MTLIEFRKWAAYFEIDNYIYTQTDINIAQLLVIKSKNKITLDKALPKKPLKKQTREEVDSIFLMIADAVEENKKRR